MLGFVSSFVFGLIFLLVLPAIFPDSFTFGITNLLKDPQVFHLQAVEASRLGWSQWQLRPHGQFPSGLLAVFYKLLGFQHPVVLLPILSLMAGLSVRLTAAILDILGVRGRWWPVILSLILTITPTSFSWMVYPHKDAFIVPGFLLLAWALLAASIRKVLIRHYVAALSGIILICLNKQYFAEILLICFSLIFPFLLLQKAQLRSRIQRLGLLVVILTALVFAVRTNQSNYSTHGQSVSGYSIEDSAPRHEKIVALWKPLKHFSFLDNKLRALSYTRERYLVRYNAGNTNYREDIQLDSANKAIAYFPHAIRLSFLEPVPWRYNWSGGWSRGVVFTALQLEMLLFYFLVAALIFAGRKAWNTQVLICLALALPFMLIFGYAVPNIGTINRYRFPFIMMIKIAGFAAIWASSRNQFPGRIIKWIDPPRDAGFSGEKKKLLFLVPDDETFLIQRLQMGKAALAGGFEVHVASQDSGRGEKIRQEGFVFHSLDLNRGGLNPIADIFAFTRLVFFMARLRPWLLHNVSIKPVLYGSLAAGIVGIPRTVNLVNGLGYAFERRGLKGKIISLIATIFYRNAMAFPGLKVIFQNPDDRQQFLDERLIDENKTLVIRGSGVDTSKFYASPQPNNPAPEVLFVGRLLKAKGLEHLVEASKILREKGIIFKIIVVGEPDERNPDTITQQQVSSWEEEGLIEWKGRQNDMPPIYRNADIVCLPSYYREGLPLTLLEAASSARPLVTTNNPGCREAVTDGITGFLVPIKDPQKLSEALEKLLLYPALRQKMGEAGRSKVEAEFSGEHVKRQLLAVYRSFPE